MKDKQKATDIASQRMQLLAPLFQKELNAAQQRQIRLQIMEQTGLSERTLRRYLEQFRENGYEGLLPKPRKQGSVTSAIPDEILTQAILLRMEVPGRSVASILNPRPLCNDYIMKALK